MKNNFTRDPEPILLSEIIRAARTGGNLADLSRDQLRRQDQMREAFGPSLAPSAGVMLPWYERESRSVLSVTNSVSVTGDLGGITVATEVPEIGTALRDYLVLEKLGARIFGGLRGDVTLPRAAAEVAVDWKSENAAAPDGGFTFGSLNLSPHRVTAYLDVSDQLFLQDGPVFEAFLRQEAMKAAATAVQRALINGTGANSQPLGILRYSSIPALSSGGSGGPVGYSDALELERIVTEDGKARGSLGWLTSPTVRKQLRATFVNGTGSAPVWALDKAEELLGWPAGVTSGVPITLGDSANQTAIVFGDWRELIVAFWGPGVVIEAVRDADYARAGKTLLTVTIFADGGVRQGAAFTKKADITA